LTKIEFTVMTDLQRAEDLLSMMRALYAEDEAATPAGQSRFAVNIEFLVSHPSGGRIVLFHAEGSLCGYALVVPYWSNEFGGPLLFIDKMFVVPEARNPGIGQGFFRDLDETRPFEAVALALGVIPGHHRARRLYESLGFRPRRNSTLTRRLGERSPIKGV